MKTFFFCALLLVLLSVVCLAPAEQDKPTEATRTYQAGLQAFARKDDRAALAAFQQVVKLDASHADAHYQLAELHIERTEWELAMTELKACLTISPHDEKASELLGYIYLQTEAYLDALEVYGHLIEAHPESAVYRNNLGIVYMNLKKPRQAITQFETATRLNTTNAQIYRNLANAYRQIGEQVKAEQAYQRYRALTK